MGRSVGTHPHSLVTVFIDVDTPTVDADGEELSEYAYADYHQSDLEFMRDDIQDMLSKRWPSFHPVQESEGREGLTILKNEHAKVVVYDYFGIVSVNLVPREDSYTFDEYPALAEAWCKSVSNNFTGFFKKHWSNVLTRVGVFSNGEAVYTRG